MDNKDMPAMPLSIETRQYEDSTGCTHVEAVEFYEGLTKREHFAGLAMQALINGGEGKFIAIAEASLKAADALLAELDKASK